MRMTKGLATFLSITLCISSIPLAQTTAIDASSENSAVLQPTNVTTASDNCVLLGIEGTYYADAEGALDLINSYRYEACENGYRNPSTGETLTLDDYVPIQWSSDLEYIARIRSAEATVRLNHVRPNDTRWSGLISPNGVGTNAENIAWNYGTTLTDGIEQWYAEKEDYLNDTGNVTGHYRSMIDPKYTYTALSLFHSDDPVRYSSAVVGEFKVSGDSLDTTSSDGFACTQVIEVLKDNVAYALTGDDITYGESETLSLTASATCLDAWGTYPTAEELSVISDVTWTSSDDSIVSVSDGEIVGESVGTATISVSLDGTEIASVPITVNALPESTTTTTSATTTTTTATTTSTTRRTTSATTASVITTEPTPTATTETVPDSKYILPVDDDFDYGDEIEITFTGDANAYADVYFHCVDSDGVEFDYSSDTTLSKNGVSHEGWTFFESFHLVSVEVVPKAGTEVYATEFSIDRYHSVETSETTDITTTTQVTTNTEPTTASQSTTKATTDTTSATSDLTTTSVSSMTAMSSTTTASTTNTTDSDEPESLQYGDTNMDGYVDLTDAVLLNKVLAGVVNLSDPAWQQADCTADGMLDGDDSLALLRFLVHLITSLPA